MCFSEFLQFGKGYDNTYFCYDAPNVTETLVQNDSCVEITPNLDFYGVDTVCIVTCYDTVGLTVCDTTSIVVIVPAVSDSAFVVIPPGETDTVCVDSLLEWGINADRAFICSDGEFLTETIVIGDNGQYCLEIESDPRYAGSDTTCIVHCYDTYCGEFCDTTYIVVDIPFASIGDTVWHDIDGDGLQEPGEPGIPDIEVRLYDKDGNLVAITKTNSDGYFLFEYLLPGDYYLEFLPGPEWTFTAPDMGNDSIDSDVDGSNGPGTTPTFTLMGGEHNFTVDLGLFKCVKIGDFVWFDLGCRWNSGYQ